MGARRCLRFIELKDYCICIYFVLVTRLCRLKVSVDRKPLVPGFSVVRPCRFFAKVADDCTMREVGADAERVDFPINQDVTWCAAGVHWVSRATVTGHRSFVHTEEKSVHDHCDLVPTTSRVEPPASFRVFLGRGVIRIFRSLDLPLLHFIGFVCRSVELDQPVE